MKFFIPYHNSRQNNPDGNIKSEVDSFIKLLREHGFPGENLEESESGIAIETDSTVLSVNNEKVGLIVEVTRLCYGNTVLIEISEQKIPWDQYQQVKLNQENHFLPRKLRLSKEEIEEEKAVAAAIASQKKENVPKRSKYLNPGEILNLRNTRICYEAKEVKEKLIPSIEEAWLQRGYEKGPVLQAKIARTANEAVKIFDGFANKENERRVEEERIKKANTLAATKTQLLSLFDEYWL